MVIQNETLDLNVLDCVMKCDFNLDPLNRLAVMARKAKLDVETDIYVISNIYPSFQSTLYISR